MKSLVFGLLLFYSSTGFTFMSPFPNGEKAYCVKKDETQFTLYKNDEGFVGRNEKSIDFKKVDALSEFESYTITNEDDGDSCVLVIKHRVSNGGKFKIQIGPRPNFIGAYVGVLTSSNNAREIVSCRISEEIIKSKGCLEKPNYIILNNSKPKSPAPPQSQPGRPSAI